MKDSFFSWIHRGSLASAIAVAVVTAGVLAFPLSARGAIGGATMSAAGASATLAAPAGSIPVYRFLSPQNSSHFYTASAQERDSIIKNFPPSVWTYEGVAYAAFTSQQTGTVPLFRFWSARFGDHFYTASSQERDNIIAEYPSTTWDYEGVAFYVYPESATAANTLNVSRFWSADNQQHFYTASVTEKNSIIRTYPANVWSYEGEAFRVPAADAAAPAAPLPAAPVPAAAPTSGPSTGNTDAGPTTTGVPSGTTLSVVQGDLRVTVAGTVLDSLDIHGIVYVDAPNVTIRNSVIRGSDTGSSGSLVTATGGFQGLVISHTEIYAAVPSPYVNGIMGSNFTASHVNIHSVIDTVHLTGSNVVLTDSWLHDNLHYTVDPTQGNTPSHDDSVQIQIGSNIRITNNNISGAFNSGVQITQNIGKVSDLTFSGNTIDGGGCSFNISEGGKGPVTGVSITGNTFGRHTKVANCAVIAPTTSIPSLDNNWYVDGAAVTVHRG